MVACLALQMHAREDWCADSLSEVSGHVSGHITPRVRNYEMEMQLHRSYSAAVAPGRCEVECLFCFVSHQMRREAIGDES